jgi:hypothetical protein
MSGIQMGLLGSGGILDIQTVTVGAYDPDPFDPESGYAIRGFRLDGLPIPGSIVDGTSNIYAGATIEFMAWYAGAGGSSIPFYFFGVNGSQPNSGWTRLTIGNKTLLRADATFIASVSTGWQWTTTDDLATQAFGATGSTVACIFT